MFGAPPVLLMLDEKQKKKFYHSSAWEEKRADILRRDHYECQECRRRIAKANHDGILLPANERRINRASLVHHIVHLEDAPELGLDDDNLEAVCMDCHNRLHGRTTEHWAKWKAKKHVTQERW